MLFEDSCVAKTLIFFRDPFTSGKEIKPYTLLKTPQAIPCQLGSNTSGLLILSELKIYLVLY